MRLVCPACKRNSIDRNVLCTEINCPIDKHIILGDGQVIGDIKVVKLEQVTSTYALYSGSRDKETVLLKVAHQDESAKMQLMEEARFLLDYALQRLKQKKSPLRFLVAASDPYPGLPVLLPAYANANIKLFPSGRASVRGQDIVFTVMQPVAGIPLSQYLAAVPEPWFDNVAYVITRLAYILNIMHAVGVTHARLSPEAVWVEEDENHILRPTLMDFGLLRPSSRLSRNELIWLHEYHNIAYIAPEIAKAHNREIDDYAPTVSGESLDIYGLGLILYEMLAGKPRFDYLLRSREIIVNSIKRNIVNPIIREDIKQTNRSQLIDLAKSATANKPQERSPSSFRSFIKYLEQTAGKVPPSKPQNTIWQKVWRIALFAGVIVGTYLLLSVLMVDDNVILGLINN